MQPSRFWWPGGLLIGGQSSRNGKEESPAMPIFGTKVRCHRVCPAEKLFQWQEGNYYERTISR